MHNEFTAIIEPAQEGGYIAYCPEILGANGQGETIEECCQNLQEAIILIIEDRRLDAREKTSKQAIYQKVLIR